MSHPTRTQVREIQDGFLAKAAKNRRAAADVAAYVYQECADALAAAFELEEMGGGGEADQEAKRRERADSTGAPFSRFYDYEDCLVCGTYNETCLPRCKGCGGEGWRCERAAANV